MADRKHTPDILGEILGSSAPTVEQAEPAQPAKLPIVRRVEKPKAARIQAKKPVEERKLTPEKPIRWEYQLVTFQEHGKGWRPRYCNGVELDDWMNAPLMHDYINELAGQGWELAAASAGERLYGSADRHQLYFRRRR